MCLADKCCFFMSLDVGCIAIGISSFILSAFTAVSSIVLYCTHGEPNTMVETNATTLHLQTTLILDLPKISLDIIFGVVLLMSGLWMLFSILLVIGIKKNKAGFMLGYFSLGIVVAITLLISALLELLQYLWRLALGQIIVSMVCIHFLVVVHTAYDLMQRGKHFGDNAHSLLLEN